MQFRKNWTVYAKEKAEGQPVTSPRSALSIMAAHAIYGHRNGETCAETTDTVLALLYDRGICRNSNAGLQLPSEDDRW
jgi:hypothetical protein